MDEVGEGLFCVCRGRKLELYCTKYVQYLRDKFFLFSGCVFPEKWYKMEAGELLASLYC